MLTNWRSWCRLCAKCDGTTTTLDIFVYKDTTICDLSEMINKFFNLSVSPYDGGPTLICNSCFQYLMNLRKFSERCMKSDLMYSELLYGRIPDPEEADIQSIRNKFGMDDDNDKYEDCIIYAPDLNGHTHVIDQYTDTSDLNEVQLEIEQLSENNILLEGNESLDSSKSSVKLEQSNFGDSNNDETENLDSDFDPNGDNVIRDETEEDDEDYIQEANQEHIISTYLEVNDDVNAVEKKRSRRKLTAEGINKCEICLKVFYRRRSYLAHIKQHVDNTEIITGINETTVASFSCSQCSKRFLNEMKLKQHEVSHLPNSAKMIHPCPYCDKKFTRTVNVQAHVKTIHHGERPFICEECGKSFSTKGTLKDHQIIHSDDRPFQCQYCQKKFKNLPRLRTHEDIHNETTYVCPHCGLQLNTKRTLKMHMVVHSDAKKYKCHYCGNEYKRSKALKNHLILHTGLRPYICPFCDKTFANGSNCRSHKKKAHPAELAAAEAAGENSRVTNIPKLEHLQPKLSQNEMFQQDGVDIILEQKPIICSSLETTALLNNIQHSHIIQPLSSNTIQQPSPPHVVNHNILQQQRSPLQIKAQLRHNSMSVEMPANNSTI